MSEVEIEDLQGKTIREIKISDDKTEMAIVCDDASYKLSHYQDCCEKVYLEDVCGEFDDLIGETVIDSFKNTGEMVDDSALFWSGVMNYTFYTISSAKGCITLRWCSSSNGYYSHAIDIEKEILNDIT